MSYFRGAHFRWQARHANITHVPFAGKLKRARLDARLNRRALARLLAGDGATTGQIDGWRTGLLSMEKGKRVPNDVTLERIKDFLPNLQITDDELRAARALRRLESPAYRKLEETVAQYEKGNGAPKKPRERGGRT